jgi:sortase A
MAWSLSRRKLALLSACVVLSASACAAPQTTTTRGSGTVYNPPDSSTATQANPTPTAAPTSAPTPEPTPLAAPIVDPIVPNPGPGSTYNEMHVMAVPAKAPIAVALPAKRLIIPSIGLDSKVIQLGTKLDKYGKIAWETAPFAVGQHKGMAGPGQNGNMVLSGHISSPNEGNVFHALPQLKVGEGVIVATDERQYLYRVESTSTVSPDDVSVLDQTPDPTLTLLTCYPDRIYSQRWVVKARLV